MTHLSIDSLSAIAIWRPDAIPTNPDTIAERSPKPVTDYMFKGHPVTPESLAAIPTIEIMARTPSKAHIATFQPDYEEKDRVKAGKATRLVRHVHARQVKYIGDPPEVSKEAKEKFAAAFGARKKDH